MFQWLTEFSEYVYKNKNCEYTSSTKAFNIYCNVLKNMYIRSTTKVEKNPYITWQRGVEINVELAFSYWHKTPSQKRPISFALPAKNEKKTFSIFICCSLQPLLTFSSCYAFSYLFICSTFIQSSPGIFHHLHTSYIPRFSLFPILSPSSIIMGKIVG